MKESRSEEGEDRFEPLFNIHKTFCHSDLIFYLSLHNSVTPPTHPFKLCLCLLLIINDKLKVVSLYDCL